MSQFVRLKKKKESPESLHLTALVSLDAMVNELDKSTININQNSPGSIYNSLKTVK